MNKEQTDRLIKYCKVPTQARVAKADTCSNPQILVLSKMLQEELKSLGANEVKINKYGCVYARFDGTTNSDPVCLLAHLDTAPDAPGDNVNPRIVKYEGVPIEIKQDMFLEESKFPFLKRAKGHEILITDGNTLLGGDDKAGVSIIMTAISEILKENKPHRTVEIVFTTDEEIGIDAKHVTMSDIRSKYGYTIDGGSYSYISTETFNGSKMKVDVIGKSFHPGSGKNQLVNAIRILEEFDQSLPKFYRPENTDKREPFIHIEQISGDIEKAKAEYILRAFETSQLEEIKKMCQFTANVINEKLGYRCINLDIEDQYYNMKVVLDKFPEIEKEIEGIYNKLEIDFKYRAVRGGTSGSELSFMGLPCPNLGTGGYNMHGKYEYVDLFEAGRMVEVCKGIMLS